jgi:hypothetical protein
MELESMDLVASLQALPETDPVDLEGIQFGHCHRHRHGGGGGGARTCGSACVVALTISANTFCIGVSCA